MISKARFRQADITRLLEGARAAGVEIGRIEIEPNGKIVAIMGKQADAANDKEWADLD